MQKSKHFAEIIELAPTSAQLREDKTKLYLTEAVSFQEFADWFKSNL